MDDWLPDDPPTAAKTPSPNDFGRILKELRLAAAFTQEALAKRAGISSRAVSDLERNAHRLPRLATVALIADALELTAADRARLSAAANPWAATPPTATSTTPTPPAATALASAGRARPLTPLIGRAGLVTAIQGICTRRETRLLTLTGPGGVGKTRLALEVSANLEGQFADGILFIDLSALRDSNLVMVAVADHLGIDDRDSTPILAKLSAALRDKHLLLVLDNFEQVLPARSDLIELLETCHNLVALVTSRAALRVRGERECRVAPLELPEPDEQIADLEELPATALFLERSRAAGFVLRARDTPAITEICRRLEGLPLAIELAAARIRVLPPIELLARLSPRLPMLTGGPHDLPDRQRTMRDAIGWSYQLLTEPQQALFRQLSVFFGGCTLDAVESILLEQPILETLSGLLEANLIRIDDSVTEVRYTMLETIREYGLEKIGETDESMKAFQAHARYFVEFAEQTDRLQPDEGNIRAALDWTTANTETTLALRLCAALSGYWQERGQLGEGLRWNRQTLALAAAEQEQVPASVRISALVGATRIATDASAFAEARRWSDEAVALAIAAGTTRELLAALIVRGGLATEQARYTDAAADLEQAIGLAGNEEYRTEFAEALIALSYVLLFTGESERAEGLAEKGLAIIRERRDFRALGKALRLLAWQFSHSGNYSRAELLGLESLQLSRNIEDTGGTAAALRQLGAAAGLRGDQQLAASRYAEALAIAQSRGDERQTYQLQCHLAHPVMTFGDLERARELAISALGGARRFDDRWAIGMTLTILGHIDLADGRFVSARELFAESSSAMVAIGNPTYISWSLEGMAAVAVSMGEFQQAAVLCAARENHLSRLESGLPPLNPAGHRQTKATIDRHLGAQEIARAADSASRPIEVLIREFQPVKGGGLEAG